MHKIIWLKSILENLKPVLIEIFIGSFFINLLAISVPIFVLQVYDRVISHAGISTLQGLMIGMLGVVFFDFVLRQTRSTLMQKVAINIDVKVNDSLFEKITSLPLQKIESTSGSYWQLLFQDVITIRNTLSGSAALLLCDLPFAIIFIIFIFIIASPIAWILIIIFLVFTIIAWRASQTVTAASKDEKNKIVSKDSLLTELISARSTVKSLNFSKSSKHEWEVAQETLIESSMLRGNRTDFFVNLGHSLTMTTTVIITTAGAISIIDKELTIGALIATNMLAGRLLGPLNQLIGAWRLFTNFKESISRLNNIFSQNNDTLNSSIKIDNKPKSVTLDKVSFNYDKSENYVLNDISLEIVSGSINTIIGSNGCGKTTLLKTILGLYSPSKGRILIDGADINQIGRDDLDQLIGYVPQETFLFNCSIKENILKSKTDASDDEIINACKSVNLHKIILDMPNGYGTLVGEQGQNLSSGIRRRICIARSLLGQPPILIMDEPTNNLDQESEILFTKFLQGISNEKCIIIVSHNSAIINVSKNLILLNRGKVIKSGEKESVIEALNKISL